MMRTPFFLAVLLACGAVLWPPLAADAQIMYKYVGPDGKMVYSDHPPPPGTKFDTIRANTKPTGVTLLPGAGTQDVDAAAQERKARDAGRDARILNVQQEYDKAVADLEAAKEPREGDRSENKNGTSHLSEAYFDRIAPLEKRVEEMRRQLDEARRN